MAIKDREQLKEVSLEIAQHLSEEGPLVGIVPLKKVGVRALGIGEEGTDGWSAKTGSISLPGTHGIPLEIWMDRWTGGSSRRFYCGFVASDAAILKIVASAPARYEPRRVFTSRDVASAKYVTLKEGMPNALFGCPVHERLTAHRFCGFGLYFRSSLSTSRARSAFVRDAVEFFVICSDAAIQAGHQHDFPSVTERRLVTLHKRAEFARNGRIAALRKQMDKYTCKVCSLRLEDQYGSFGHQYAEAHHIVPLHLLGDVVETTVHDLITVCPNCHRMLHRMTGKAKDWMELRKLVATHHG